jgi:DNA-binding response OmpR family regulator
MSDITSDEQFCAARPLEADRAAAPGDTTTILVVEDDDLHFEVVAGLLAKTGARVVRETTLAAARARLGEQRVDLVVSDLLVCDGMPDTSLRTLLELPVTAPVIVVTSWSGQLASHVLSGGSRLKLFDKNNFDYGLFLATVRYLLSTDGRGAANPFER